MEPSAAMREYLAEIYRLQQDSPTVSTTSLADRLNVSAPAVPRMLKRLKSAGYVKHVPYQGVELTDLGRLEALTEIRRHRILEVFLVQVMGFTWDEAHDHADALGPGLNDTTQRPYDKWLYRERHLVECFINKIKHFRRVFSRFDKLDGRFLGFLQFVCSLIWLR
ncbi:MAG: helix-turn-helix domain-containing protein [Ardenticatenaceae bacterium]|nr:helix-turn-helix domain-containing protein [Ardenticatenaceae bacterium]